LKHLGVLFFFAPLLILPFFKKDQRVLVWILFVILLVSRGLTPYLNTPIALSHPVSPRLPH
jgi:hypothetical protein